MCLDWFKNLFNGDDNNGASPPIDTKDMDFNEVYTLLKSEYPDAKLYLTDSKYKTCTKKEMERFLKEDFTDEYKYVSQYYDCDDFSFRLMGQLSTPEWGALTVGILWTDVPGGAHAVNCFISQSRDVYIIEPQSDKIFKCPDNWKPFLVMM